ncbi:MAG: 1-deoxy-D-xylulose-5-phosphate synthase [Clostridia bacterium]|nr:1-deoxy-D-xylulose-5-phosphate synthase [Clostridia bacterium]
MYKYLDKIKYPSDIKKLTPPQLKVLCEEIRELLVSSVSKNGGHLASNLGVVELTVALHRTLDAPNDKIIWDVGHQSYVHKILTGRADNMDSIRQLGGVCGFCSPKESEFDSSYSGHASTSLGTAAGFAQAREIRKESYNIAAVIGDGAFTGGLAFEALNNIGNTKPKMLIVLNDNEMSISRNVGSLSTFLSRARTNKGYTASKRKIVEKIKSMPGGGEKLMSSLRRIKRFIKYAVAPNQFFEQLGITYLGPVNGHNIEEMENMFSRALSLNEPVLVHVITKKGKGYSPAEKNPHIFHGIGPFEKETGETVKSADSYSKIFGDKLCELAEKNENIAVITPAMISGSGLSEFSKKYPRRLHDVGIAEGYAVTYAGGIAAGGALPVVAVYSTFLQRAYDNIIHDVALGNYHVVFAVDRAGLVAGDGATHQGVFDISYLTSIPNITLLSPSSYSELCKMLDYAVNEHNGPIAIRYPRGTDRLSIDNGPFVVSQAKLLKEGKDITLVCEGQSVTLGNKVCEKLSKIGINAELIDVRTVKPLDFETIFESAEKTGFIFTIEENLKRGGMGEMIASEAALRSKNFKIHIKAIDDKFVEHGSIRDINNLYGFTAEKISGDIERMLKS